MEGLWTPILIGCTALVGQVSILAFIRQYKGFWKIQLVLEHLLNFVLPKTPGKELERLFHSHDNVSVYFGKECVHFSEKLLYRTGHSEESYDSCIANHLPSPVH